MLNAVDTLGAAAREAGVTTVSAGNHARAVAMVCAAEGIPARVFMPRGADTYKIEATRALGATVDTDNDDAAMAFARMDAHVEATGATVLHPFDDPAVIAGAGTVGLEIADDLPDVACVVVPVGGGGLLSGVALAMRARCPGARIVAVEPELAATLTAALDAGRPVPVPHGPTRADALAPPSVGRAQPRDLPRARRRGDHAHRGRVGRRAARGLRRHQAGVRGRRRGGDRGAGRRPARDRRADRADRLGRQHRARRARRGPGLNAGAAAHPRRATLPGVPADPLFQAAGSLRATYAEVDWAATPLGPVASWSPALRGAVDLMLQTRFPVTLLWGPEFVQVYNEAYVTMLADKHPRALGRPCRDVFPEAWEQVGPLMQGVLDGHGATWFEDASIPLQRGGILEEAYFTFSYSPVRGADGTIEGVMDIATETTGEVLDRRRLRLPQPPERRARRPRARRRDRLSRLPGAGPRPPGLPGRGRAPGRRAGDRHRGLPAGRAARAADRARRAGGRDPGRPRGLAAAGARRCERPDARARRAAAAISSRPARPTWGSCDWWP